jgi:hypothetical protein
MIKNNPQELLLTHADLLAERHASYVSQFVTRGNDELYAILADVLKLHEQLESSKQRDKLVKAMRQHLREVYGIKTQANTKTTALVTKYVTRASRKTAHVYSRVLEVAIADGIRHTDLVEFIKQRGGIDKVRMQVNSAEAVAQHKALHKCLACELRSQLSHVPALGSVHLNSKHSLPEACDVHFTHLLCRLDPVSGQHEVVAVMYPSSALEAQAMGEHLIMLDAAATSDNGAAFYSKCKQQGLNMDLIHRWMHANSIPDAASARAMGCSLKAAANSDVASPSGSLLKLAA